MFNTHQYDQGRGFFNQGLEDFQRQLSLIESNKPWSKTKVFALSTDLLSVSKELMAFLSFAASLPSSATTIRHGEIEPPANAWVTTAITDLRILCHRYSLTNTRIAAAMERHRRGRERGKHVDVKTEKHISSTKESETFEHMSATSESSHSNATSPTTSTDSDTSAQSWWSRIEGTSPTGTVSSADQRSECESK